MSITFDKLIITISILNASSVKKIISSNYSMIRLYDIDMSLLANIERKIICKLKEINRL